MMTNYQIADFFELLAKLSDIHGENSFKVKSYASTAFNIEKVIKPLAEMNQEELYNTKGIGSGNGKKIEEILQTGSLKALTDLIEKTPPGIIEMLKIKGLGPKKIVTIWKELEIETIGELLYACNENRLLLYKGFGEKNQQSIKESIDFYLNAQGSYLFAQVETAEPIITKLLVAIFGESAVNLTGSYLRHSEIIDLLEYVIVETKENILAKIATSNFNIVKEEAETIVIKLEEAALKIALYPTEEKNKLEKIFFTTGTEAFNNAFKNEFPNIDFEKNNHTSEVAIFEQANIQYIPTFLRETESILTIAKQNKIPKVIETSDIKGIIHNHSDWSDGSNTIEEMANDCIENGFEYLVISDHSKSAFYAKGLEEERIKKQHIYIDSLNEKLAPFKIFKSIECDILNDGSLDYSDSILSTFDLVITSVHSNLKMTEEKAMARLLTAIENPYTTILGHLSGRLLLSRPSYPLNYKTIIDACAANDVVIELNAHPSRLDIDWRFIDYALQKDVLISIDPDAHHLDGFKDIHYGVIAAQKAMVQAHQNLSSFSLRDFEEYIYEVRERKGI